MKGVVIGLTVIGLLGMVQSCASTLTSSLEQTATENTEQKQAQPEVTPVVMTAAEKAANDADWEAKQVEIGAKQKAEAEAAKHSQRFAACTEMDKGSWPDRIGEVDYLTIARDAVDVMCPWHNDRVANMEAQRAVGNSNLSEAEKEAAVRKLWREADAAWAKP